MKGILRAGFNYQVRIYILIFVLCFLQNESFAQYENILTSRVQEVDRIREYAVENTLILETSYGAAEINNPEKVAEIKSRTIYRVDLIYTTYKDVSSYDQKNLNKKRLQNLNEIAPELFQNELIDWNLIGQTQCKKSEYGLNYFHGFIIYFRPVSTAEFRESEVKYLDDMLRGYGSFDLCISKSIDPDNDDQMPVFKGGNKKLMDFVSKETNYPEEAIDNSIFGTVYVSFVIDIDGETQNIRPLSRLGYELESEVMQMVKSMPKWIPGRRRGKPVKYNYYLSVTFSQEKSVPIVSSTRYAAYSYTSYHSYPEYVNLINKTKPKWNSYLPDSTVSKVLDRNSSWENMLIVSDFTGSMSPYTAQLLIWHQLNLRANEQRIKYFTFFNDGNLKPDHQKIIGETGGIYHGRASDFEEVKKLAYKTIRNGGGGDCPENNIEAVLEAEASCPSCNELVMIADNFATPRDLSLLANVNRPLKIILCGTYGGCNAAYLNLALQTGGSVHTIEQDITDLAALGEGEVLHLGNMIFKIKNGKFVRVRKI